MKPLQSSTSAPFDKGDRGISKRDNRNAIIVVAINLENRQKDASMTKDSVPPNWRFRIGVIVFVVSWCSPLLIPLVTASKLSSQWKTLLSGALAVGIPLNGQVGSRHQKYEKRAAPADDEYDHADAKTPIGVHRIIRHLDILPSVFYFS